METYYESVVARDHLKPCNGVMWKLYIEETEYHNPEIKAEISAIYIFIIYKVSL